MAIAGDNYKYDVFFSYAWGKETGTQTLRDWSRMVADRIKALLQMRFSNRCTCFIDRDELKGSAIEIDAKVKDAAQNCAFFVAVISTYYQDSYGLKELEWFLDRMKAEGASLADRMCIFLVQEIDDACWPAQLRETTGNRLYYQTFHCPEGDPLELTNFMFKAPMPALAEPVRGAFLDIGFRLTGIREKTGSRAAYRQRRAEKPIMFLEAEPEDAERWAKLRAELKESSRVLPAQQPQPATEIGDPDDAYGTCDGLVLLRSRNDDEIGRRLKRAYLDKRGVEKKKLKDVLPWALLDEQDEPPPEAEVFDIPRVVPQGDWVGELQRVLRDA